MTQPRTSRRWRAWTNALVRRLDRAVDASIVLKWLREEKDSKEARALSREHMLAPPLSSLEVVNVAARKWGRHEEALVELARELERSGLVVEEPPLAGVTRWAARG